MEAFQDNKFEKGSRESIREKKYVKPTRDQKILKKRLQEIEFFACD